MLKIYKALEFFHQIKSQFHNKEKLIHRETKIGIGKLRQSAGPWGVTRLIMCRRGHGSNMRTTRGHDGQRSW